MSAPRFSIGRGTLADAMPLLGSHYRAGAPGVPWMVLVARDRPTGAIVGALVASHPVLNGPWRRLAWPGPCARLRPPALARWSSRRVRTISRVVVDPRVRGGSLGTRLVRELLARSRGRPIEALAAMGTHSPLFARAGMRRVGAPTPARDRVLARALARLGVCPIRFADGAWIERAIRRRPALREVLGAWARAGRSTRALAAREGVTPRLAALAAARLVSPPAVFVHP